MSLLQELLNLGLVDIGSDDSRFEKMQLASAALAAKFLDEPRLLIPATLISLDDSVEEHDPMFALIEELVIAQWKTLRNTHVNRPRELLRSIAIDALAAGTDGNANAAGVVWQTAASPLRHGQASLGKAGALVETFIESARELSEREAVSRAGLGATNGKPYGQNKLLPENAPLSIESAIVDADVLKEVARTAGPQYPPTDPLESPNPHWPNVGQTWSQEFTPRMSAALVKAANLATGRLAESISKSIAGHLNTLEEALQTHESTQMRLGVLWWSESLYSPSLQVGYRDLSLPIAAVAAAVDLASIVPTLAPASVSYVLGETVLRIARLLDAEDAQTVASYLQAIAEANTGFGDRFPAASTTDERVPLVTLVGEAAKGYTVSRETVRSRTGVDGSLTLSSADFAMWIFRDLQAHRLLETLR